MFTRPLPVLVIGLIHIVSEETIHKRQCVAANKSTGQEKRSFCIIRVFLIRGASSTNLRQLAPPRLLAPPSVLGTCRLFEYCYIIIAIRLCSVCPSQKMTIVETRPYQPIDIAVHIYLWVTGRLCSLEVCLVCIWVGSEPGDFCCSDFFV